MSHLDNIDNQGKPRSENRRPGRVNFSWCGGTICFVAVAILPSQKEYTKIGIKHYFDKIRINHIMAKECIFIIHMYIVLYKNNISTLFR